MTHEMIPKWATQRKPREREGSSWSLKHQFINCTRLSILIGIKILTKSERAFIISDYVDVIIFFSLSSFHIKIMPLRSKTTGQSKALKKKNHNLLCSVGQHMKAVWESHNDNDQMTFNFVCCAGENPQPEGLLRRPAQSSRRTDSP